MILSYFSVTKVRAHYCQYNCNNALIKPKNSNCLHEKQAVDKCEVSRSIQHVKNTLNRLSEVMYVYMLYSSRRGNEILDIIFNAIGLQF